ncbi:hypothetical protein [Kineococcus sp. SYSU DK018]|uniref:hypothetical protein n=1 Tax=Kineococcus sp. SYSU DK018 TaxID=3383139 RepID=UPI003D7E5938
MPSTANPGPRPAGATRPRGRALRAWHAYRAWRNLPATLVAVGWARLHGVRPVLGADLLVECAPMPPRTYGRGGTTIGNAWLHGGLGGPGRRRHESRHADQYALLGTAPFLALYGLNALVTRNDPRLNVFERWAGLADGGYAPARGTGSGRTRTARTATSSSA